MIRCKPRFKLALPPTLAPTLSGFTQAQLKNIGVGMAITGTGIGASAKVLAVNLTAGTVIASVASTATASNIAMTFTPQADLLGLRTGAILILSNNQHLLESEMPVGTLEHFATAGRSC